MKTTFISTYSLRNSQSTITASLTKQLADASEEVSTGRHADVGLTLGYETGKVVSLRSESDNLQAMIDSNSLLLSSMDVAQLNLQSLRDGADTFKDSLLSVPGQNRDASVLAEEAETAMASLYSALNATDGSSYVFAGINTGVAPLVEYDADVGADGVSAGPQELVETAFADLLATLTAPDNTAADITAEQMESFLENEFAALFEEPNWSQTWSTASDSGRTSQISTTETATTTATANEDAFKQILMAYTMVAKLQTADLNTDALEVVMAKSEELIVAAYADVSDIESRLGSVQTRIEAANEHMDLQQDIIATQIGVYEDVDAAEAKTLVDTLTTQLEMSYSLTSQLSDLSILNYV